MADDINIEIGLDTRDAVKDLAKFQRQTLKSVEGMADSFASLRTIALGAVAFLGGRQLVRGINTVTEAAAVQEDAINSLNTALALSGEFSEEASKGLQDFASSIQETTKFGDEAILQQLALAKAFGASNDQAKEVTQAAVELAAATGKSLEEATRQVSKTLGGFAGELGEVNPAIKALTAEQLKAGEAAKILIEQYGGSAAAQVKTFSGVIQQTSNLFGDLQEELGFIITQNPAVIAAIKGIGDLFKGLIGTVSDNRDALSDFVGKGLLTLSQAIGPILRGFAAFNFVITEVTSSLVGLGSSVVFVIRSFLEFKIVQSVISALGDAFRVLETIVLNTVGTILTALSAIPGVGSKVEGVLESVASAANDAQNAIGQGVDLTPTIASLGEIENSLLLLSNNAQDFGDSITDNFLKAGSAADQIASKIEEAIEKGAESTIAPKVVPQVDVGFVENIKTGLNETVAGFSKGIQDTGKSIQQFFTGGGEAKKGSEERPEEAGKKTGEGFLAVVGGGLSDTFSLFTDTFSGALVNNLSGVVSGFTSIPSQILEAFKNLDSILKNAIKALPGIIKDLTKSIGPIFNRIIKLLPQVFEQIFDALPGIFANILDKLPSLISTIFGKIIPEFIEIIPVLVDQLAEALPGIIDSFLGALPRIILAISKAIPKIVRSIAASIAPIVQVIAKNLGPIISALVEGILTAIPEIIVALIDEFIVKGGIFKIVGALIAAIPQIALALVQGSINATKNLAGSFLPDLGKQFASGIKFPEIKIPEVFKNPPFLSKIRDLFNRGPAFVQRLNDLFSKAPPFIQRLNNLLSGKKFRDRIKSILDKFLGKFAKLFGGGSGGGGGGGFSVPGFAEGGQIPAGFPNDTFPARLTSGEFVIDRSQNQKLDRFLSTFERQGLSQPAAAQDQNVTINLQIGEQELANVLLNLNRQGFRTA